MVWGYGSCNRLAALLNEDAVRTASRNPYRNVFCTPPFPLSPFKLRSHVLLIALRANTVAELGARALLDVALQRAVAAVRVANALAVRADRQQPFERMQLLAETENPLRHRQAGRQLLAIHRFREKVVDAGVHRREEALAPAARGEEDEVRVATAAALPDAAAQIDALQLRHLPIGDHHARLGKEPRVPRIAAVGRLGHLVAEILERGLEQPGRHRLVFGDEDLHARRRRKAARLSSRWRSSISSRARALGAASRSPARPASSSARVASVAAGTPR